MSSVIDRVEELVAEATSEGIRATMDPRKVVAPCVLFVPPELTLDTNCGGTAAFEAYVIVPPPGDANAWRTADRIAAEMTAVIPGLERVRPGTYGLDDGGPQPALVLSWSETVDWP